MYCSLSLQKEEEKKISFSFLRDPICECVCVRVDIQIFHTKTKTKILYALTPLRKRWMCLSVMTFFCVLRIATVAAQLRLRLMMIRYALARIYIYIRTLSLLPFSPIKARRALSTLLTILCKERERLLKGR